MGITTTNNINFVPTFSHFAQPCTHCAKRTTVWYQVGRNHFAPTVEFPQHKYHDGVYIHLILIEKCWISPLAFQAGTIAISILYFRTFILLGQFNMLTRIEIWWLGLGLVTRMIGVRFRGERLCWNSKPFQIYNSQI